MLAGAALATEAAAARRPAAAKVLTVIIIFTPEVDLYWKPIGNGTLPSPRHQRLS
jgi:hypothetical protein